MTASVNVLVAPPPVKDSPNKCGERSTRRFDALWIEPQIAVVDQYIRHTDNATRGVYTMAAKTPIEELRTIDQQALRAQPAEARFTQDLIDARSGGTNVMVRYVVTPPEGGSPAGLHVHDFEQLYYILEGVMDIEIEGREFQAGPGELVVFRQGIPHRNWNGGTAATVHLAINSPLPDPQKPISRSV